MTIYGENLVPILYRGPDQKIGLSEASNRAVEKAHAQAQAAIEAAGTDQEALSAAHDEHLLLGHSVVIHNKHYVGDGSETKFLFSVGASDLDEALKEAIGAFDIHHVGEAGQSSDHQWPPDWVACSHKELGKHLADYYSCELRPLAEVL